MIANNIIYWDKCDATYQKKILTRPVRLLNDRLNNDVQNILKTVKQQGNKSLINYTLLFDKINLVKLKINKQQIYDAKTYISNNTKKAIYNAFLNIQKFHKTQINKEIIIETIPGIYCQQLYKPIQTVGLYIPGGNSSLFSTVLMLGIPAKLASCQNIILCSPPPISNEILFAASLCGISNIFQIGGAHAIAAMAYGTETIPKVNKIFGPGNAFVTEAKRQISLSDTLNTAIDMPAGPSELMILSDHTAYVDFIIADLISQAEHGNDSQVILVTTDIKIANEVFNNIHKQYSLIKNKKYIQQSLKHSYIIIAKNMMQCIQIVNMYAPEHLIIQCNNYKHILSKINNAASIFLGHWAPEAVGDYATGTNHVLPTYGYAQTYSCLGVLDFQKRIYTQQLTKQGFMKIAKTVEIMAQQEKLLGHKNAVTIRKKHILQNKLLNNIVKTNKHCIKKIIRHDIINLLPYQSARLLHNPQCQQILLNANESPQNYAFHLKINTLNRYPEPQPQKLKYYYTKYINNNIDIKNLLITRGADEGIELIMRAFCMPYHDAIIFCPPTYGMYQINAQILGIKYYTVKCLCNFQLNLKKIIHKINNYNIKIIYICNPNNPTGNLINKHDIITLLQFVNNKIIIVLDEAYIEFCHTYTLLKLIKQYNNVIILRTLSKAFGLAGLRCGFIIAHHSIIHVLKKVIAPYPIPQPVSDIAVQALHSSYISIVFNNVKNIIANREWLISKLKYLNIVKHIYPSVTNYILVEFINVQNVFNYLLQHNIIVRQQNHITQLKNCLRITIGTYNECKQIIVVLQQLLIQ